MAYEKLPLKTGEIITEEALAHIQTQADEANAYTDQKISEIPDPPPPPVTSVNSKTGAVVVTKSDVGLGSVQNYGIASKAQAEAGTANNAYMTPLRVAEAIEALAGSGVIVVPELPPL